MTTQSTYLVLVLQLLGLLSLAQPKTSIQQLNQAYAKANNDATRLELLEKMFGYYRPISLDSAQMILDQALPIARRSGNQKAEVFFLTKQGTVLRINKADPKKSLSVYLRALRLAEAIQDSTAYSDIYYGIGRIHDEQKNNEEAIGAFLKAIRWAKTGIAEYNGLESLAVHYANNNDLKQAEAYFLKAKALVDKQSPKLDNYQVRLNNNLGEFYSRYKRDTTTSLYYYRRAAQYPATDPNEDLTRYMVEVESLASTFFNLKDYQNSLRYALKVLSFRKSPKYNIQTTIVKAYHILFKINQIQGNYRIATFYADSAKTLSDSLAYLVNSDNIKKETYKLEAAFNLERKQKEIELLAAQQKAQRIWTLAAAVIVLLLSVFSLILYRNRQNLSRQKQELATLNSTKDKLFAILSHDLRSPVASLKNYLMLQNWGALSQEEFTDSAKQLGLQLNGVHAMLENVLNWAVSQMQGTSVSPKRIHLYEAVQAQIDGLHLVSTAKGIVVSNHVEHLTEIQADPNHVSVIVRNLLQNAIKFTDTGGRINVGSRLKDNTLELTVQDTGVGMSAAAIKALFEANSTYSTLGTALEQGTGLGLRLVKEMTEANGGSISVESTQGQGTTFRLCFPAHLMG